MKIESPTIDKGALRQLLKDHYDLSTARLNFVPQGEESYGYILETVSQSRYFVKMCEHDADLNGRYEAVNRLHMQCDLGFVVYPHATRYGRFHANLEDYTVAVFDFVDGIVADHTGFGDVEWKQAATLTAALHQSVHCPALPLLPRDQFAIWFEDWLLRLVNDIADIKKLQHECEKEAWQLIAREKNNILKRLEKVKQLAQHVRVGLGEQVLTHGDLKPENFIKDKAGNLYIIDWTKIAIAPPERDLVNFIGDRFELFLEAYVNSYDKTPILRPELFEFYHDFLLLWGIADYGSWILLEEAAVEEKEHAWMELQQHLQMNNEHIHEEIRQTIRRVASVR